MTVDKNMLKKLKFVVVIYVLAQCAGSITGFYILQNVMDCQTIQSHFLGGCTVDGPATTLILEFVCTFVFLFLGVTLAFDKKRCKELGIAMVCVVVAGSLALAVFVSIIVTGKVGYGGAGLNPAKCLGSALLQGDRLWDGHWVFWVGPFFACIAYYGYSMHLITKGGGFRFGRRRRRRRRRRRA